MILALFVALIACCFACGKRRREKKPEISTPVESSFVHKKTNSDFYGMYVVSGPSDSPPSVSGNSTISSKNHSEEIKGDFHASDGGGAARGDLSYSMQDYQNATAASLPGIASTQPIVYNGNVEKYADTASWVAEHSSSPAMAAATAGMMMKHESGASTIVDTPAPMSDSAR